MNLEKENQKLNALNDNIEILEGTYTLHPLAMAYILRTNHRLADAQYNKILNHASK